MRFVDTPEFQRLRQLYQLGLARFVYPACTHSRFEHCIGTYHLATRLVDAIQNDPNCSTVRLSEGERLSVMLAALCHDLGTKFVVAIYCSYISHMHSESVLVGVSLLIKGCARLYFTK